MSAVTECHEIGQAMDANVGVYQNKLTKQIAKIREHSEGQVMCSPDYTHTNPKVLMQSDMVE